MTSKILGVVIFSKADSVFPRFYSKLSCRKRLTDRTVIAAMQPRNRTLQLFHTAILRDVSISCDRGLLRLTNLLLAELWKGCIIAATIARNDCRLPAF